MRCVVAAGVSLLVIAATPALAAPGQTSAQAEALFQEGIKLVDGGRPALGCPKLEESERLEPQVGTEFRLADCYERIGRTASAWALFVQVQGKVETAEEKTKAKARVDALEPNLVRVRINVPDAVASLPDLEVRRDGVTVGRAGWTTPAPVDPGEHTVRVSAKGFDAWTSKITADKPGETVDVDVPELRATAEGASGAGLHPRRVAGIVVGAIGVVGLGIGGALAGVAASKWSDAQALCPTKTGCSNEAHDASLDALNVADGATGMFVAGSVVAATGIVLIAIPTSSGSRAPSTGSSLWFAPAVAGARVGGSF